MSEEIEHDDSRTALCNQCMKRDDCMPGYTVVDLDYAAKIFEAPAKPDECKQYLPYRRYRESGE